MLALSVVSFAPDAAKAQRRTYSFKYDPDRIARKVFDPLMAGYFHKKDVAASGGQFLMTPDGIIRIRHRSGDMNVRTELFRLAMQVRHKRRFKLAKKDRATRRRLILQSRIRRGPPPLSSFFTDMSLERGDVVVTSSGYRVFLGGQNYPYTARNFATLQQWRGSRSRRKQLLQLEGETRRGAPPGQPLQLPGAVQGR